MPAFASWEDVQARLGVPVEPEERSRATTLLELASDAIRTVARQRIDRASSSYTCAPAGSRILLPERPVVSIESVTDDSDIPYDGWSLDGDYLTDVAFAGRVTIEYTHGFDPVPLTIVGVCLEVVTRVWVNPGSVAAESYGSERVNYANTTGIVLTPAERQLVRETVRRGSQSVDIR